MSATNVFENELLRLVFNATTMANIAQNASSSPITNIFVSLHTADPGEAGTQSTSEATYTGYARVGVIRTTAGWTVTNNVVSNAIIINFPSATAGTETITHFGIGTLTSGTGKLLFKGPVGSPLAVSVGITPAFNVGDLTVTAE